MNIEMKDVSYVYNPNTPFESHALKNVNLVIERTDFIGLIGHTGSGKSTLVQHMNGLMKPTSGDVLVGGVNTKDAKTFASSIRQKVGLVFQYPEHQLFEETIALDVAFGPKNLGLSKEEIDERVRRAMMTVSLDYDKLKDKSPFELSGGQKRRVAIAGVLALEPEFLVLDEPTAGLDPRGRDEILYEIRALHEERNIGVVLVSHSMEDIANLTKRVVVMDQGGVFMDGNPADVLEHDEELERIGLGVPQVMKFMKEYRKAGHDVETRVLTVEHAREVMIDYLRGKTRV